MIQPGELEFEAKQQKMAQNGVEATEMQMFHLQKEVKDSQGMLISFDGCASRNYSQQHL